MKTTMTYKQGAVKTVDGKVDSLFYGHGLSYKSC